MARITATGIGLIGAVVFSQAPEYGQQYRQRLGGAIDELRLVVDRFDAEAARHGVDREQAILRLDENMDPLARGQATNAREVIARLERLERQREELSQAGQFGRLVSLARLHDPVIARNAYAEFEAAVPVTQEGAIAAGSGFVAFWAVALAFLKGLGLMVRRRRPAKPAQSARHR